MWKIIKRHREKERKRKSVQMVSAFSFRTRYFVPVVMWDFRVLYIRMWVCIGTLEIAKNPDPGQLYIFLCLVCARWLVHFASHTYEASTETKTEPLCYAMLWCAISMFQALTHSFILPDQNIYRTSVVLLIFCSEFPFRLE